MITMNSADSALKTLYLGVIADQLNGGINPLLAKINQTTSDVWGKEIRKVAPYGLNGGFGAGLEDGDLPTSSNSRYVQYVLTLKNLYGRIEITDKAIRASQNSAGAFVNLLEAEMENLIKACKFNFGRMLFGDGSGVLCKVQSITNNTIRVDDVRNLMEGMLLDIYNHSNGSKHTGSRRILSIDRHTKTIVLGGGALNSFGITAGDYMTVQGSLDNELTGLGAIFDDECELYGIDRSNFKWMVPNKLQVSSITDVAIQRAIDELEESSGSTADFIVCSAGVKRAYQDYLVTNRSNIDVMNLQGGYKAISYNGIPLMSDRFCPSGTMYILNTSDFHLHQLCDWRWLEGDNGHVIRQVADKPIYTATLVKYADLICDRPFGQAVISSISEEP